MRAVWIAALAFLACALGAAAVQAASYERCVADKHGHFSSGCYEHSEKRGSKAFFELEPVEACVPQKKGRYAEANCETLDVRKGKPKGKFELAGERGFTATSAGHIAVVDDPVIVDGPELECTAARTVGEITSPRASTQRTTFSGCQFEGLPCQSAGPYATPSGEAGVIVTNLLEGRLLGHGEQAGGSAHAEPAAGEVWDELVSAEHEPYQLELECSGAVFLKTQGYLSGRINPADAGLEPVSRAGTATFDETTGEQGLLQESSETGFAGPWSPAIANVEALTAAITYEQPLNIADG